MRVAITGHLGLTGSAAYDLFKKKGWEVIGVDNNQRARLFNTEEQEDPDRKTNWHMDLRDEELVEKLFKMHGPFDAVLHIAGQPSHDWATENVLTDFDINARATVILFEAIRRYSPMAVTILVSTDKVYGENMMASLIERETRYEGLALFDEREGLDFAGDRSFFGCSKTAADIYAQQYAQKLGMKVVVFRPGCITGRKHQGAPQHGFLSYLAKCIKEEREYHVHGNGKQVRDQIHASDLAQAFLTVVENYEFPGVYNIGGGPERSISLLEAAWRFEDLTGKKAKLVFGAPNREGDRLWDVHDVSLFRRDYPMWDYKYDLEAILRDLV